MSGFRQVTAVTVVVFWGSDSNNRQINNYLKKWAVELYGAFPASVKGCVICVDVRVDRNSGAKEKFSTSERDGFLTTSAKCFADSGSDSGLSSVTQGMMSLGHKDSLIHTAIGSENKVIHEMKISLDNKGVVQNVKTQGADKDMA